ncbi:MAG: PBP1A family penicillin-binding protein [Desulfomicrobium sp.]|nr:PBP1A family penicillin-binding protein [Pseudomonadota bacterium]MBV1712950.1 PBP1A family penicillin-binding protein [Desulfomicrobium sp.]MBU4571920.1 PBP1A family penicillin-binding protein [Pseudomonadota bacterium]MBU4596069.1 PBP1A family penicillin-binding protein [Pseudomonadota bacterium]MBV1721373.1 PBP1A family penicillin-binding protein [Desulfomicrobium sp.]
MKVLKIFLALIVLGVFLVAGAGIGLYYWAQEDLPGFTKLSDYSPALATTVRARDGRILGYFYREKRFLIPLSMMSPITVKAFLASEDAGFYQHEGVDLPGIVRAAMKNFMAGSIVQGGSTITQQVIKSMLLTPERSYERKLKEVILAYRLEKYLNKDEILTIYLNQIFLGAKAYGVEAAAREYFGVSASQLSTAQAALLAGLPKAPSRYSPYGNPERARERQLYVLTRLRDLGWIDRAEFEAAVNEPLDYTAQEDPSWKVGPYYLEEVRRQLVDMYGEDKVYAGGLQVRTAMDMDHQVVADQALRAGLVATAKRHGWQGPIRHLEVDEYEEFQSGRSSAGLKAGDWLQALVTNVDKAEATVRFGGDSGTVSVASMSWARVPNPKLAPEEAAKVSDARKVLKPGDVIWVSVEEVPEGKPWKLALEQAPKVEGALVSIDPRSGEVLALCGGYDFFRSQFNRATQALRQPGSAFKPIVYSAALDNGFTAASIVLDAPIVYQDGSGQMWKPENFEGIFYGPTLFRTALVKSRNLVTIRVAQQVGINKVVERGKALGLTGLMEPNLSLALGSGQFTPLNLCQAYTAFPRGGTSIKPRLIESVTSPWGEQLFLAAQEVSEAMPAETAYIISNLLQEAVQDGTGARAKVLGRPVAGKTGTTNDEQDAWFMGFSPYLLTGVWVGYDQIKPMGKFETGARAALPIWLDYRTKVEPAYPIEDFQIPPGIVMARVDARSGRLAGPGASEAYMLPFVNGTEPLPSALPDDFDSTPGSSNAGGESLLKQIF